MNIILRNASLVYLQIVLVLKSLQMYETTRLTVSIQIFSHVLAYTNLCIANPILYNCFSENFRKAFRKVSQSSLNNIPCHKANMFLEIAGILCWNEAV